MTDPTNLLWKRYFIWYDLPNILFTYFPLCDVIYANIINNMLVIVLKQGEGEGRREATVIL